MDNERSPLEEHLDEWADNQFRMETDWEKVFVLVSLLLYTAYVFLTI